MIIDRQDNITVITQENVSLNKFVANLQEAYPKLKNDHLILNLLSLNKITANDLMEFLPISREHRTGKKSFVLVTDTVNYNDVHSELIVAPTLQEAYDVVEMEDIERDLDSLDSFLD